MAKITKARIMNHGKFKHVYVSTEISKSLLLTVCDSDLPIIKEDLIGKTLSEALEILKDK